MEAIAKLFGYAVLGLGFIGLLIFLSFVFAFPTMWLVNYLFAAQFLSFVFGGSLTVYKAWALNAVAGTLFKSISTSSK